MSAANPVHFSDTEAVVIELALEDRIVKLEKLCATDTADQKLYWASRIDHCRSALETLQRVQAA